MSALVTSGPGAPTGGPRQPAAGPRPAELHVFECRLCGKVFDSREAHPSCPECDAEDVERLG